MSLGCGATREVMKEPRATSATMQVRRSQIRRARETDAPSGPRSTTTGATTPSTFGGAFQREKIPGGGASGKGVRNRIEAGDADCPSVSSGLIDSGDAEIGGFF